MYKNKETIREEKKYALEDYYNTVDLEEHKENREKWRKTFLSMGYKNEKSLIHRDFDITIGELLNPTYETYKMVRLHVEMREIYQYKLVTTVFYDNILCAYACVRDTAHPFKLIKYEDKYGRSESVKTCLLQASSKTRGQSENKNNIEGEKKLLINKFKGEKK